MNTCRSRCKKYVVTTKEMIKSRKLLETEKFHLSGKQR